MRYHYSQVMPKLTKLVLGLYEGDKAVGCCTLGWGVRPEHTIRKIFPSLGTKDYLEIGKMCVADECPKNTESNFLSQVIEQVKRLRPEVKILYTWADAIIGKPGYVYQAANFYFGGHIWTEIYLNGDGTRVHPRTMQGLSEEKGTGRFNSRSYEVTTALGFQKWFGMQLRYCYPLCSRKEWARLQAESSVKWTRGGYPKLTDLQWERQTGKGTREKCEMPPFVRTLRLQKDRGQQELFCAGSVKSDTPSDQLGGVSDDSHTALQIRTNGQVK
jgi:hypothetical protein